MIVANMEKLYPSAKILVRDRVASRLHAKDDTLYSFDENAQEFARNFMGWVDLAENPPYPIADIQGFADRMVEEEGIHTVYLIGQGGSTQAPMTVTKYNKIDSNRVDFKTLDSDSPVRLRSALFGETFEHALILVSSKSGGTLEPRMMLSAVRDVMRQTMDESEIVRHLVAITDPGSNLEKQAKEEGWLAVFGGEPTVGGRFSALSVFGLLPAALAGIDLDSFIEQAAEAEKACSEDSIDNPAITLAAFLYDNYQLGRDKFSFLTPKRGRVLGLWIEQLVAESLGKGGEGILPNIEVDALVLSEDPGDRSVIMYQTKNDLWDERKNFEMSLAYVDQRIPRLNYHIESVEECADHFIMWEYAVSMCAYLMKVCPFDQPDVQSAKTEVLDILKEGMPDPTFEAMFLGSVDMGNAEVRVSPCLGECTTIEGALTALLKSIKPGDFFAVNAFLPFAGEGRREALETIRHVVVENAGVVSCLEVGPRYLHSTGQLHKGGPNKGVFLILSADELKDVPLNEDAKSLGNLAKSQAVGDWRVLASRNRRALHLHLPDNSGVTLRALSQLVVRIMMGK